MASQPNEDEACPFPLLRRWLQDAEGVVAKNPNAMSLATVGRDGRPAVRLVLLKDVAAEQGYVVFYTNYRSRKGRDLERYPWAAGALYWAELGRQIRIEGRVVRSPDDESDAYFAKRPFQSQLNAWISEQSEPLADDDDLAVRAAVKSQEWGMDSPTDDAPRNAPRPPFWGGYRLWCDRVEFWAEGAGRFHERVEYARNLDFEDGRFQAGPWRRRRLQP